MFDIFTRLFRELFHKSGEHINQIELCTCTDLTDTNRCGYGQAFLENITDNTPD